MMIRPNISLGLILCAWFGSGCALLDDGAPKKKLSPTDLIATPASYYSTPKARYLGTKYKENLDRLAERIVRHPKTAQLQFANNISSVGGIGFFTHSAAQSPDERYLEVVLATPETFETKGEYSEKVHQLFSRYGSELLGIIAGDSEIFQDKELRGYGLNLTWRTITAEASGNRVSLARAIIYFHKERVATFLRQGLNQNELLSDAVIFTVEDNGPLHLVSYQPREIKPDFRPDIREDNLPPVVAKTSPSQLPPSTSGRRDATKAEPVNKVPPVAKDTPTLAAKVPVPPVEKAETPAPGTDKEKKPLPLRSPVTQSDSPQKPIPAKPDVAANFALDNRPQDASMNPPQADPGPAPDQSMPSSPSDSEGQAGVSELPEESYANAAPAPIQQARSSEEKAHRGTAEFRREDTVPFEKKPPLTVKAGEPEAKVVKEASKPMPELSTKIAAGEAKLKPATESKSPDVPLPGPEKSVAAPAQSAVSPPIGKPTIEVLPRPAMPTRRSVEKTSNVNVIESRVLPQPEAKSPQAVGAPGKKLPLPDDIAKPVEAKPSMSTMKAPAEKQSKAKEASAAPPEPFVVASRPTPAPEPAAKAASPVTVIEPVKSSVIDTSISNVPVVSPTAPALPDRQTARESVTQSTVGVGKKSEPPIAIPLPPPAIPAEKKSAEKPAAEQLALLRKPETTSIEKKPLARLTPRPLEGFIIQIAFSDKQKAQNWAEKMEQRGYAVSVTEAGTTGALRVRLGNFTVRDEAERQLRNFKQEGLNGIVINLPQAFRPEARSSIP